MGVPIYGYVHIEYLVSSELCDVEWPESSFTSACEPVDNNSETLTLLLCK